MAKDKDQPSVEHLFFLSDILLSTLYVILFMFYNEFIRYILFCYFISFFTKSNTTNIYIVNINNIVVYIYLWEN